ncbi:hypothetical protein H5410_005633 [Solanum commersonii]|uniref:Uncharacterized protein n=1 Tax=Solanum commersonii TaxID=4109 RepID=A0A9J6A8U8_SOLCO|nr:hypothetical protein H5410_005633 [Solanum commersonii]
MSFLAVSIELIVLGKEIMSHVIHRYSLLTNMWSYGMRMKATRCSFGFASLGEIVILAAGYDSRDECTEMFVWFFQRWGDYYLAVGCDSRGSMLNSAELYNLEAGT